MRIRTREAFIDYCLRSIGAPVIKINVDAEQVSDRIDEALRYYIQYHYNGAEREVMKVVLDQAMVDARAVKMNEDTIAVLKCVPTRAEFENALLGAQNGGASPPAGQSSSQYMMTYPFYQPMPAMFGDGSIGSYDQSYSMKSYVSYQVTNDVIRHVFRPEREVTFRHANNTVTFDVTQNMRVGDAYLFEVYTAVNPLTHEYIWEDIWLQEFASCLIRVQWGRNLTKFGGVQLPTGITLNGDKILDEALQEKEKLLEKLRNDWEFPCDFFLG